MITTLARFLVFSLLAVLLLYGPFKKQTTFLPCLCVLNIIFYIQAGFYGMLSLVLITLISFFGAFFINAYKNKKKLILMVSLLLNISILCFFKYGSIIFSSSVFSFMVPLGLSFYTFQGMSYLIDIYREQYPPTKSIFNFFVYISFFATVQQGPIERYNSFSHEVNKPRVFNYDQTFYGFQRMLWGIFKKMVIGDRLGNIVNTIYSNSFNYQGLALLIAACFFTLQLYFDFSGFMDITIGAAKMIGIRLPENFEHPFQATSLAEFWRRWHITLGAWFRDYVYYPLLKSAFIQKLSAFLKKKIGKKGAKYSIVFLTLLILWVCIGIWHGITLNFVIGVGVLNSIYLVIGQITSDILKKTRFSEKKMNGKAITLFRRIRTFFLVTSFLIFFRINSFSEAIAIIKKIFTDIHIPTMDAVSRWGINAVNITILTGSIVLLCTVPRVLGLIEKKGFKKTRLLDWVVCFMLCMLTISLGVMKANQFIYFQF